MGGNRAFKLDSIIFIKCCLFVSGVYIFQRIKFFQGKSRKKKKGKHPQLKKESNFDFKIVNSVVNEYE